MRIRQSTAAPPPAAAPAKPLPVLRAAPLAEAWRHVEVMPDPGVEVV